MLINLCPDILRMKVLLSVVAGVVLLSMVQAEVGPTFGVERLLFHKESLTDNFESMDEDEKETESVSQGCCLPKSFQSTINYYQPGLSAPVKAQFFVDVRNRSLAFITDKQRQVVRCSGCTCTVTTIVKRLRLCQQRILTNIGFDDLYDGCVPQNAKYLGTVKMGNELKPGRQKSSMIVQQWAFSSGSANIRMLVTDRGCFPVADIATRTAGPCQAELVTKYYFNVETPVKDQTVFGIPLYCRKATEEEAVREEEPDLIPFYLRFK